MNKTSPFLYWVVAVGIAAGLVLSIVSWLNACTTECSAAHEYRFFGMPFEWIGVAFFGVAGVLHYLSYTNYVGFMMAGAFGSEVVFVGIQKYVIGSWCPLCLSIAAVVAVVLIAYGIAYMTTRQKGSIMKQVYKGLTSLAFFTAGFIIAVAGVAKPADAVASTASVVNQIEMGNKSSPIKVYFISDWFCDACKKTEPAIAKIYPAIQGRVGFFFIDLAVHANTANYTPYNIAFIINDKAKYIEIRHELDELSYYQDAPTDVQMAAIAKKMGVPFHEVSFREVEAVMKFYDEIAAKYGIEKTPTMVIENSNTKQKAILNGTTEITLPNVEKTIDTLSKKN